MRKSIPPPELLKTVQEPAGDPVGPFKPVWVALGTVGMAVALLVGMSVSSSSRDLPDGTTPHPASRPAANWPEPGCW